MILLPKEKSSSKIELSIKQLGIDDNSKVKGLSEMQRFILQEAYHNEIVTNAVILIKWYGFKPSYSYRAIKFNRQRIGMKRYLSASVAVSRSLTRLETRGLLKRTVGGYELTENGTMLAVNFAPP